VLSCVCTKAVVAIVVLLVPADCVVEYVAFVAFVAFVADVAVEADPALAA